MNPIMIKISGIYSQKARTDEELDHISIKKNINWNTVSFKGKHASRIYLNISSRKANGCSFA